MRVLFLCFCFAACCLVGFGFTQFMISAGQNLEPTWDSLSLGAMLSGLLFLVILLAGGMLDYLDGPKKKG